MRTDKPRPARDHRKGLFAPSDSLFRRCHALLIQGCFCYCNPRNNRAQSRCSNMSVTSVMLAAFGDAAEMLPASRDHSLMTVLLILVLSLALVLGLVTLLMVLHFLRSSRLERQRAVERHRLLPRERRFQSPLLSVPSRWLAVRSEDPQA